MIVTSSRSNCDEQLTQYDQHYAPTQYELFHKVVAVDGQDADVELWDTAGDLALEQLGRLSYLAWDAVFLCFSVNSVQSFDSARTQVRARYLLSPSFICLSAMIASRRQDDQ